MRTALHRKGSTGGTAGNGVYENVKARVIAHDFPAGKRILVEPLADQLFVSSTPVREALIRLAAERIIKDVPKAGFFVKEISESEVTDLYSLQQLLLEWCLRAIGEEAQGARILKPPNLLDDIGSAGEASAEVAARVLGEIFVHISMQSGNSDVVHIVRNINDRTHYIRKKYYETFASAETTLRWLCQTYYQKQFGELREGLRTYFREAIERLPGLLRAQRVSAIKPRG